MDVKAAVATSMDPFTSALCMAQHLLQAGRTDVEVIAGKDIHDAPFRAGIWVPEELVGLPLREKCESADTTEITSPGEMQDLAQMLKESERDDWVYISLCGMTTVAALTEEYPEAATKVKDLVVMGTNICDEMVIYVPDIMAPVQETNVACDPTAANMVFSKDGPGKDLYVMPVGPGHDSIEGERYQRIIKAAESGLPALVLPPS